MSHPKAFNSSSAQALESIAHKDELDRSMLSEIQPDSSRLPCLEAFQCRASVPRLGRIRKNMRSQSQK